jgi:hypothetical protein
MQSAEAFVAKWSKAQLSERGASQEHFIDLCHLLGQPTPAEADATGDDYCFEKHVKVVGSASKGSKGDFGFVDVWKRGCFAGNTNARANTNRWPKPTASSTSTATIWTTRPSASSATSPLSKSALTSRAIPPTRPPSSSRKFPPASKSCAGSLPIRSRSNLTKWWIHQEPRGELRSVLESAQVLLTPRVSKHCSPISFASTASVLS